LRPARSGWKRAAARTTKFWAPLSSALSSGDTILITPDLSGQRAAIIRTKTNSASNYQEFRELYGYDGTGRLATINVTSGTVSTTLAGMGAAAATGGFLTSQFGYDRMGRQTSQSDFKLL
jgi:hypothetical protein